MVVQEIKYQYDIIFILSRSDVEDSIYYYNNYNKYIQYYSRKPISGFYVVKLFKRFLQ
jgi:hypothetical protein